MKGGEKEMRKMLIALMVVLGLGLCNTAVAGTAFIPIWQHGYGVTYFNNLINTASTTVTMTVRLFDIDIYTTSAIVLPMSAWMSDTGSWDGWYQAAGGPAFGFGWGMSQGNGPSGTMYAWGAIYGTVGGKITGLTVLAPQAGF